MLYGEYFLLNKTLVANHTLFSWTPAENSQIYCTWLPDIFFYLLYKHLGLAGLFVFRYLGISFAVLAIWMFARQQRVARVPLTWFICLLVVILSRAAAFSKPEIFSYILMTATVWNWWHIRAAGDKAIKNCYFFPLILLIWINSHGGVIFGIAFLASVCVGELLNVWCGRNPLSARVRWHFFCGLALSLFALIITPYGWRAIYQLILFVVPTTTQLAYIQTNSAYVSPFSEVALALRYGEYASTLVFILILLVICDREKRLEFSFLLSNILFAFLFTRYLRTTFYWPVVFAFSATYLIPTLVNCCIPLRLRQIGCLVLLVTGFYYTVRLTYDAKCKPFDRLWMGFGICEFHPVESSDFIAKNLSGLRIGNTFGNGAYLLWHLRPKEGIFIDSRQFPYRSWFNEYYLAISGVNLEAFTAKYRADLWCIDISYLAMATWFQRSKDWELIFYGKNSAIYVKKGIWKKVKPGASPAIDQFRSLTTGVYLVNFALMVGDQRTVEKVIARFNSLGNCPSAKKIGKHTQLLEIALRSYKKGNYQDTVQTLDRIGEKSAFNVSILLAYSLVQSAFNAWRQGDIDAAWRLAERAWEIHPESPMTVYNVGVIAWYRYRMKRVGLEQGSPGSNKSLVLKPDDSESSWRKFLEAFLRNRDIQPQYETYYGVADAILDERFSGLPPLFPAPR